MASRALLNNPAVFYSAFVGELRRHKWPSYPETLWKLSLRIACDADAAHARQSERHKLDAIHLMEIGYCQQYRVKEHRESLGPGDRSAAVRELEARCDAFLASRGIIAAGFHQY